MKVSDPESRSVSMTGWSGWRNSQKALMPPSKWNVSSAEPVASPATLRWSETRIVRPGTRKAVWRARLCSSSREIFASGRKIWRSGQKRTRVPVTRLATRRTFSKPPPLVNFAFGPSPANVPTFPRWKLMA